MQIPMDSLRELERERGIALDTLVEAIERALAQAYLRMTNADPETRRARCVVDEEGNVTVFAQEVKVDPDTEEVDVVREWEDTPADFGRIAAQTAKQVMLQGLREAERDMTYGEYAGREGDIVTGIVQQSDHRYTILDLGKTEALMPPQEQIPHERYGHGSRVKAYIVEVRRSARGPQIIVSRTHPNLIRRLFELEVPEILDGVVEIKGVAREPGHRSKIAVASNDPNVDPVGACVGAKGSRVRMVMNELRGEKIDIVPWSGDLQTFVGNALSPAKVREVRLQPDGQTALVVVPDYQLSLAIGKEGQNARLAARLTGLRVDIKSESQIRAEEAVAAQAAAQPGPSAEASPSGGEPAAAEPAAPAESPGAGGTAQRAAAEHAAPAEPSPAQEPGAVTEQRAGGERRVHTAGSE